MPSEQEITRLLCEWNEGEAGAFEALLPLVESELRRIAARHMRRENPNHTLQTTALINEAFLKLVGQRDVRWQNRAHFFALSSQVMRRVLLDHARTRDRAKRGGGAERVGLEEAGAFTPEQSEELLALDEALRRLAEFDPFKGRVVDLLSIRIDPLLDPLRDDPRFPALEARYKFPPAPPPPRGA